MWQAIANADTSLECWSTITDIEHALAEHVALQPADAEPRLDPLMTGGAAGVALFFAYLHAAGGNDLAADRTLEALDMSAGALANRSPLPTLYSGFIGVGWVFTHLTRELFEGDGDLALEIDDALRELLSSSKEKPPFELIGGLAGYGTYLVERLPDPGAAALLGRVLDLLESTRDAYGAWFTEPDWLPQWQRELMPRGAYNLGVAHGIPGVIGFLAAAHREGFDDPRVPRLAEDAVRWVIAQKRAGEGSHFPSHVPLDGEPRPTRTAWCYGDIGVAAVLLSAAQSFGREDWREEAITVARAAARRSFAATMTMDAGLCHGATGIAHLFNRIYQATGDEELRAAALTWYGRALDMRRPGEGLAGLLSWVDAPGNAGMWKAEPGFLSGVAGIGLGLLAAVTDVEPAWDRVLLVAVPPRNGDSGR
ncbi:MAG TPA: lanthionine synthetase C family protein [Thermoanaerobaculia bacterium]|jgi:lantibiotic modifying enzyme|nr:lanthionine synthetase C family protein [Thermoanaerobaculia bacterium]